MLSNPIAMTARSILSFLRVSVSILFYFMFFFTVLYLFLSLLNLFGRNIEGVQLNNTAYSFNMMGFDGKKPDAHYTYSTDSIVGYQQVSDQFKVRIAPDSPAGYYSLFMQLVFLGSGLWILWIFMKIFGEMKLDNPFMPGIFRRLKILAILFIVSDVLKFLNYFILNSFINRSIQSPDFELITTAGNGITTGLIIWVIAVIYQRGITIQEENALTV